MGWRRIMPERISRDTFRDKRGTDSEQGQDEDYYPEDAYSPWKKGNVESFMSNLSKSSGLLLVIVGAGVFVLLAFFVFLPMLKSPADTKPIKEMEAKLNKMETRLADMEQNYQKVAQLALQEDKFEQVSVRLDKLGASTTQRLDQLTREIESFHKQAVVPKTDSATKPPAVQVKTEPAAKQPTVTKTETVSPAKTIEPTDKKTSTEKFHEVKPQETLYSISKSYGMTVDELKRLNNMSPSDNTVRIGQKLKVGK
jgi:LysM repeat protein